MQEILIFIFKIHKDILHALCKTSHTSCRGLIAFCFQQDVHGNHKIPSSYFYPIPSLELHFLVCNKFILFTCYVQAGTLIHVSVLQAYLK